MCTTDIYPYISTDGAHRETREIRRCTAYCRGIACDPIVYKHPLSSREPSLASPSTPTASAPVNIPGATSSSPRYASRYFPPSPRLTPGRNTPAHESDSEGDRSAGSSGSRKRERDGRRQSRPYIYVNGQKVSEIYSPPSPTSRRQSSTYRTQDPKAKSDSARIIIVEAPPTPRTPPQAFDGARTAPPSPSFGAHLASDGLRHRPVIVDERPRLEKPQQRVRIAIPGEESSSSSSSRSHKRQTSDGSYQSRGSSSYNTASDDEKRKQRRKEKERREKERKEKERERDEVEEEAKRQRRLARIANANRKISLRPTQPIPSRRPAPYVRPTVEIHANVGAGIASASTDANLAERFNKVSLDAPPASPVWAHQEDDEVEDEAQLQRLKERMMPRRRATIGAGSRRHRVEYQDGMYRLE